jgi:hypothetical protein
MMKWLKGMLVSLIILALVGFGNFVLYGIAYSEGEAAGYDGGYSAGEKAGLSSSSQEDYEEGYTSGKQDGYTEGYDSGKADGYEEGAQDALGHGYTLIDPTYREATRFLRNDETDENEFIEDAYVCSHFARDVCNNAEAEGLRCAYIVLIYPDGGHAIIAFETIDEGLVYFDPQADERVKPVVGKRYYQCIEPKPGYYYEEPPYNDTIKDILVIW